MWNFVYDLFQSKNRSPTLPSLATDEEKKEKDETFAATSVPQAAHSWTHVIRMSLQRFPPKSCIYFDIHHHLTSAEVSVTSSARLLGVVSSFSIEKRVHWIPTICIFSSDPGVPCLAPKISKASPPPVLPPRQSGRHWNTQGTIWAADEVYRPDPHCSTASEVLVLTRPLSSFQSRNCGFG